MISAATLVGATPAFAPFIDEPIGTINYRDKTLTITNPDAMMQITKGAYGYACAGKWAPAIVAGEGLVVVHATNGTFRWKLDPYDPDLGGYPCRRLT